MKKWIVIPNDGDDNWTGIYLQPDEDTKMLIADVYKLEDAYLMAAAPKLVNVIQKLMNDISWFHAKTKNAGLIEKGSRPDSYLEAVDLLRQLGVYNDKT